MTREELQSWLEHSDQMHLLRRAENHALEQLRRVESIRKSGDVVSHPATPLAALKYQLISFRSSIDEGYEMWMLTNGSILSGFAAFEYALGSFSWLVGLVAPGNGFVPRFVDVSQKLKSHELYKTFALSDAWNRIECQQKVRHVIAHRGFVFDMNDDVLRHNLQSVGRYSVQPLYSDESQFCYVTFSGEAIRELFHGFQSAMQKIVAIAGE